MAKNDLYESIDAIRRCMDFIGLSPREITQGFHPAVIEVNGQPTSRGTASGMFRVDLHAHNGPWIEFDETIRGFGIFFEVFKPQFQSFTFKDTDDGAVGHLTVKNANPAYSFVLKVQKK